MKVRWDGELAAEVFILLFTYYSHTVHTFTKLVTLLLLTLLLEIRLLCYLGGSRHT
jgi:hypothetical protein